jgi:hypothetical protein
VPFLMRLEKPPIVDLILPADSIPGNITSNPLGYAA